MSPELTHQNGKSGQRLGRERRHRGSVEQKLAMARESLDPGQSVSVVVRRNGINAHVWSRPSWPSRAASTSRSTSGRQCCIC
ncbi:hypothetical protein D3879_08905 [Pseudomonas cavernicola]|uniref:Transposase n=1 Tax=Pseudomonas cavernicola TaxID=2320866 RepID=A0A418XLL7_9PSED|nr:hypothetical protein D3879_08905 [Pseudomonas cavernicola]